MDRRVECGGSGSVRCRLYRRRGSTEDVPFGLKKQGSAQLRELHKFFHDFVGGLYVKLIAAHVANGHGTIEWMFGGKDIDVFKTGQAVRGARRQRDRSAGQPYLAQPRLLSTRQRS